MDQKKYRFIRLIIAVFLLIVLGKQVYAEEMEKPLIKLPQVNIIGQEDIDNPFSSSGIISADIVAQSALQEDEPDHSQGFLTGSYGSFESRLFELNHSIKAKIFYYNAYIKVEDSGGDRDNSEFVTYQPKFILGIPFYEENEVVLNIDYFGKKMGLPGKTNMITPDAERRTSNTLTALSFIHKQEDLSFKLQPYYDFSVFNDDSSREDFKNKVIGLKIEVTNELMTLDMNTYQNRLINHYKYAVGRINFRTNSIDINDRWHAVFGVNGFVQEQFGHRSAPFAELVFEENEDCLHKFKVTRKFEPIIFSQTYLNHNYIEVNPRIITPERSLEFSYNLDKHISAQWRAKVLVYHRQARDYWFLSDNNNNGFYAPLIIDQVNISGINVSTEYNWSEEFNYFLSLDVRSIRSKDSAFEFVPFEPKQKISVGLTYQMTKKTKIDFVGDYLGRRYYLGNSKESLSAFFLIGSKLTYNPKDYLTFFVLVDNLLNDNHEIVRGYPSQSRSVLSGVTIRF